MAASNGAASSLPRGSSLPALEGKMSGISIAGNCSPAAVRALQVCPPPARPLPHVLRCFPAAGTVRWPVRLPCAYRPSSPGTQAELLMEEARPVHAACCYLSVNDVEGALDKLRRGHEVSPIPPLAPRPHCSPFPPSLLGLRSLVCRTGFYLASSSLPHAGHPVHCLVPWLFDSRQEPSMFPRPAHRTRKPRPAHLTASPFPPGRPGGGTGHGHAVALC